MGTQASSIPDRGVALVNSAFQTSQSQFAPLSAEITAYQRSGTSAPPATLHRASAFLAALEAFFGPAGPLAAYLKERELLSVAAAAQLAVCAKDCHGGQTVYEQMLTDDRDWHAKRVGYLTTVRDEVAESMLAMLQRQQASFDAMAKQWTNQ